MIVVLISRNCELLRIILYEIDMRGEIRYIKQVVNVIVEKTEENDVPHSNEDYNKFNEQLDRIDATISASEDLIESRTFEMAAGSLVLSLTILSLLRESECFPSWGMYPTSIIWAIFTISILLHYWSQFMARKAAIRISETIRKKMKLAEKYDDEELNYLQDQEFRLVNIFNAIIPRLLTIGIVLLIAFTCYCFFRI